MEKDNFELISQNVKEIILHYRWILSGDDENVNLCLLTQIHPRGLYSFLKGIIIVLLDGLYENDLMGNYFLF